MGAGREYEKPSVTVDCVILTPGGDGALSILLIERAREPFEGKWALPGGFVNPHESLRDAALRELKEETGVRATKLRQVGAFGDPGRDPRGWVISVAYVAVIPARRRRVKGTDDARDARWFPLDELPRLAFDHGKIVKAALAEIGVEKPAGKRRS